MADAPATETRSYPQLGSYPVNIRITVPFLPRRIFITLIIGPERRGVERLKAERKLCPLGTWGNLATIVSGLTVFLIAALFATLVATTL